MERELSYERVVDIVRRCEREGRGLRVRGGAAVTGEFQRDADVCDMTVCNQLVAYAREDMTITVQAGMTVAALQQLLGEHRQCLPVDVPLPDRMTIGGLIAADGCGSRRISRGGPRDLLIGVGVIGSGGTLNRAGGAVVKNVAGYDLCKLYTGSRGWLGAIVEASLKVVALPESAAGLALAFETAVDVEAACARFLSGPLQPASLDLFNSVAAVSLGLADAPFTLVVGFEGFREVVDAQLAECLSQAGTSSCALDAGEYARLNQTIADMSADRGVMPVRCRMLSDRVGGFVEELITTDSRRRIVAHVADGVVNILFAADDAVGIQNATERVAALGGSWLIPKHESATVALPAMIGPPRNDWPLMRRIKEALDPAGVFERDSAFDRAIRHAVAG